MLGDRGAESQYVDILRHPYLVSIQRGGGKHVCGGTITAPRWVITAAHCLLQPPGARRAAALVSTHLSPNQTTTKELTSSTHQSAIHRALRDEPTSTGLPGNEETSPDFSLPEDQRGYQSVARELSRGRLLDPSQHQVVCCVSNPAAESPGKLTVPVERFEPHPEYNEKTFKNDIGLVLLHSGLPRGLGVPLGAWTLWPVVFGPGDVFKAPVWDLKAEAGGSGTQGQMTASKLREVQLTVLSPRECREHYPDRGISAAGSLCTSPVAGGGCMADSGGPLLYRGAQVAVVSWGPNCRPGDAVGLNTIARNHYNWLVTLSGAVGSPVLPSALLALGACVATH